MTENVREFDRWIRSSFVEMNTELEQLYFAQEHRENVAGVGDVIKQKICDDGRALIIPLVREGNTDQGFDRGFDLLGNLGLYMAALRRHDLTNPARETSSPFKEASALGMHLGASLGVAPRFATSHLTTHNVSVESVPKSFTSLQDEYVFLHYNSLGVLYLQMAADALTRILTIGISSPIAEILFEEAEKALKRVYEFNDVLFTELDIDRFFCCVRPYYKPYRVGRQEYRGANAGDFSGINEIDLLLGLCRANDPYYSQILMDKMAFMIPGDQARLRDCLRRTPLLDQFLAQSEHAKSDWFKKNVRAYLRVSEAHGAVAAQHHNQLVNRFIEKPAEKLPEEDLGDITASGPPLPVLIAALEKLRDLRCAVERDDIVSSHADIQKLKALAG